MKKEIALVDCNNFFVGCEQMFNPDLLGQAVCVLSNNDGCVVARSNEAKKLGITMGMPFFLAKRQFPSAIYLSANMKLYHDVSHRIRQVLEDFSPNIEVYSIDEAFLDLTGMDTVFGLTYDELIIKIKQDIEKRVGVSVSVGLANSKVLAKLASEKAKKSTFFYRITSKNILMELKSVPLEMIWGVGRNTSNVLKKYGIFTAIDLINKSDEFYQRILGKRGLELKHELLGHSVIPLQSEEQKPKSIQRTSSFPKFTNDTKYIKRELYLHLHNACKKLRDYNLVAKNISLMLRTKDFRTFVNTVSVPEASSSAFCLSKLVKHLFCLTYSSSEIYRSSGIYLDKLEARDSQQLRLFTSAEMIKSNNISTVIDKIENKFGRNSITIGEIMT